MRDSNTRNHAPKACGVDLWPNSRLLICFEAVREGFEPPDPLRSLVFRTSAIDHSATSPISFAESSGFEPLDP